MENIKIFICLIQINMTWKMRILYCGNFYFQVCFCSKVHKGTYKRKRVKIKIVLYEEHDDID